MLVPGSDQEEQDIIEDNETELDEQSDPSDLCHYAFFVLLSFFSFFY